MRIIIIIITLITCREPKWCQDEQLNERIRREIYICGQINITASKNTLQPQTSKHSHNEKERHKSRK